jgi:hypothetical protein
VAEVLDTLPPLRIPELRIEQEKRALRSPTTATHIQSKPGATRLADDVRNLPMVGSHLGKDLKATLVELVDQSKCVCASPL